MKVKKIRNFLTKQPNFPRQKLENKLDIRKCDLKKKIVMFSLQENINERFGQSVSYDSASISNLKFEIIIIF